MKIVIAPDSFKDSLSAEKVANAIAAGLADALPDAQLVTCPMADGGEGTVEAIVAAGNGQLRRNHVQGPLGAPVEAHWGWLPDSHTAIIEMAEASGLQLLKQEQRNACITSTFGTGELIKAALDAGARRVILAIGGSATRKPAVQVEFKRQSTPPVRRGCFQSARQAKCPKCWRR